MTVTRSALPVLALAAALIATTAGAARPDDEVAPSAPGIIAAGVGEISGKHATIGVAVAPSSVPVTVYAEYGPTAAYGSRTREQRVAASDEVTPVYLRLQGLEPGAVQHFRFVLSSDGGSLVGPDQTLAPAEGVPAAGDGAVQRLFVTAQRRSGRVSVRPAGGKRFEPLTAQVALGSVIDARRGSVRLTSALPDGSTQTAIFRGGRFALRQDADDGRTDIHLRGGSFARCSNATASRHRKGRRYRRRVRSLWTSDSGGLYSTYGENSVATVRGTRWLTVDRCDGTLTRVTRGAVEVRDVRTGRTTLVRAGERHLAPAVR